MLAVGHCQGSRACPAPCTHLLEDGVTLLHAAHDPLQAGEQAGEQAGNKWQEHPIEGRQP